MAGGDIVADLIQRLAGRLGADVCPPDVMRLVESEIRRDWGGGRVYITSSPKKIRDASIRNDYRAGESIERLSARYGISIRRVRQIISVRG